MTFRNRDRITDRQGHAVSVGADYRPGSAFKSSAPTPPLPPEPFDIAYKRWLSVGGSEASGELLREYRERDERRRMRQMLPSRIQSHNTHFTEED